MADGMAVMPIKRRVAGLLTVGDAGRRFRPAAAPVMSNVSLRRRSLAALSEIADARASGNLAGVCRSFAVRRSTFAVRRSLPGGAGWWTMRARDFSP
ncbi:MAG TPA: hypothetical protein VKT19_06315, partial [Steroidobacteraceae bacterium]|nr:hypothetical protein [Steroidobacteraceae bacterium]